MREPLTLLLLASSGVGLLPPTPTTAQTIPAESVDSLVVVRAAGYFEDEGSYRVVLTRDGMLHFEGDPDGGDRRSREVAPAVVRTLMEAAASFDHPSLPDTLAGRAPYCPVVATDAHRVRIELHAGGRRESVTDDHGCAASRDRSEEAVIPRLRTLERELQEGLALQDRFGARPLVLP